MHDVFGLGTFEDFAEENDNRRGDTSSTRFDVPDSATAPFGVIRRFEADEVDVFRGLKD